MTEITGILSLKQYDIAETIITEFDFCMLPQALKYCGLIFGSTATRQDIIAAYDAIEWE